MSCRLLSHPSRQLRSRLIYNVREMRIPNEHHLRFLDKMAPVRHDNEIVVLLTGHLLVEELLVAAVEKHIPRPDKLPCKGFHDYLSMARAIGRPELSDELLDAVDALNRLRNQLVHNLEEKKYEERRREFMARVRVDWGPELQTEFSDLWLAIMKLHSRLAFAVEFDPAFLRLPSLLSGRQGNELK